MVYPVDQKRSVIRRLKDTDKRFANFRGKSKDKNKP